MDISQSVIEELIVKHLQGDLTPAESSLLDEWKTEKSANLLFFNQIADRNLLLKKLAFYNDNDQEKELNKALAHIFPQAASVTDTPPAHRVHFLKTTWFRYAAALILLLGSTAYLYTSYYSRTQKLAWIKAKTEDIAPGGYKAMLTLADGSTILLDSALKGTIAQQGNASIVKMADGQIVYDAKGLQSGETMINSMRTPRGGKYRLKLPDGTTAWLNAESSIEYPSVFSGKQRNVKVSGEVYFEVAKNNQQPFIVSVNGGSSVEVLGTSFNINSYTDEAAVKTALIEGSVRVLEGKRTLTLKPGQQASLTTGSLQPIDVNTVNMEQVIAWKNGVFNIDKVHLREVLRMLARWYDLEIVVKDNVADVEFVGEIKQNLQLSQVLNILSKMEVNFRLENKKLIVLP